MLPEGYEWIERNGRAELVHHSRVVAIVCHGKNGDAYVVIDCRMAWQVIRAQEPSVTTARQHVERWFSAYHKRIANGHSHEERA